MAPTRDMLFKWNLQEIKGARVHSSACRPPHFPCLCHGKKETLGAHTRVAEHRLAYAGFSLISYTALRGTGVAEWQHPFCFSPVLLRNLPLHKSLFYRQNHSLFSHTKTCIKKFSGFTCKNGSLFLFLS